MSTEEKEICVCDSCNHQFEAEEVRYVLALEDNVMVCNNCYRTETSTCPYCNEYGYTDNFTETVHDSLVCDRCLDRHFLTCDRCEGYCHEDSIYSPADDYDNVCPECHEELQDDENSTSYPTRSFKKDVPQTKGTKKGAIVKSLRGFSAEIECNFKKAKTVRELYTGAGKGDNALYGLGISHDGSLGSHGVEFQTPILYGDKGEAFVKTLTKFLNKNEFSIDEKCGLHIHIDVEDIYNGFNDRTNPATMTMEQMAQSTRIAEITKRIIGMYIVFESVILSFLPRSRRQNRYCTTLSKYYHLSEILERRDLKGIEKIWYRTEKESDIDSRKNYRYDNSRYAGINCHAYLSGHHLEIRYHSGTINGRKILEWANMHVALVDRVVALGENLSIQSIYDMAVVTDLQEKTDMLFDFLELPKSSREYYLDRQKKFIGKQSVESDVLAELSNEAA